MIYSPLCNERLIFDTYETGFQDPYDRKYQTIAGFEGEHLKIRRITPPPHDCPKYSFSEKF